MSIEERINQSIHRSFQATVTTAEVEREWRVRDQDYGVVEDFIEYWKRHGKRVYQKDDTITIEPRR